MAMLLKMTEVDKESRQSAPQKATVVVGVAQNDPKVILVSWQQPLPRPGITTYTVKVYEENDAMDDFIYKASFNKIIPGYYTQSVTIDGLEEFWQYKFEIEATTIIGSMISDKSAAVRTKHAAPGTAGNIIVISQPKDTYYQMDVKWNSPSLRERNGIIAQYVIKHNFSGTEMSLTVPADDVLMRRFNVTSERTYLVEVYAVNMQGQNGNKVHTVYVAQPFQGEYGDACIPDTVKRCKIHDLICHPSVKRCLCPDIDKEYWDFNSTSCEKRSVHVPAPSDSDSGYSAGALAGAVIGSVVLCVLLMTGVIFFMRTRQKSEGKAARNETERENRYEEFGMDNSTNYEALGSQSSSNVYDRIQKADSNYQNI